MPTPPRDGMEDAEGESEFVPGLGGGTTGKKPKEKAQKELSYRDKQLQMKEEYFQAKAESARLLRDTEIQLPRHEKVLNLDDLGGVGSEIKAKAPPVNEKVAARRARIKALAAQSTPKFGAGFLAENPNLAKLQKRAVANIPKKISPSKKKIKTFEHIKNDVGEIVDVKETVIDCPVPKEEVYHILRFF